MAATKLDELLDRHKQLRAQRDDRIHQLELVHEAADSLLIGAIREGVALERRADALEAEVGKLEGENAELRERVEAFSTTPAPTTPKPAEPKPVEPGPVAGNPAADIFARLDRTRQQNIDDARARHMARSRPRPGLVPETRTSAGPLEVRDSVLRPNWQWSVNRALKSRPADSVAPLDRFGAATVVPVEPHPLSLLSNIELGEPYGDSLRDLKWVIRAYNNRRFRIEDATAVVGRKPGTQFEPVVSEHLAYAEFCESFEMLRCWAEGFGGHGPYGSYRPMDWQIYTPSNPWATTPMLFRVAESMLVNMDQMPGRGSFAVQAFNIGDPINPGTVELFDLEVYLGWDFVRSQGTWDPVRVTKDFVPQGAGGLEMNCNGVLGLSHYDLEKHLERARAVAAATGKPLATHPTELVHINRATIDISFSRMPLAVIRGAKKVLIENAAVRADVRHKSPHIWIDDDDQQRALAPCEEIVLRNALFLDSSVRHVVGAGPNKRFIEAPRDLRGKVAIWKPGMSEFEVRAIDPARVYAVPA